MKPTYLVQRLQKPYPGCEKNPDGGYVRNNIPADQSIIYTDENKHPYLIRHYVETNRLHVQFIHSYDLHVPNGTIPRKFNVG